MKACEICGVKIRKKDILLDHQFKIFHCSPRCLDAHRNKYKTKETCGVSCSEFQKRSGQILGRCNKTKELVSPKQPVCDDQK